MSECRGQVPVTAKVDAEMSNRLDRVAERKAVYRAEVIRLMLDTSARLLDGEMNCPHCGETLEAEL